MCRNIKQLRRNEGQPTEEELYEAALQFVRKVSGYRTPSKANQEVFDQAVAGVVSVTRVLFEGLQVRPSRANVKIRS